MSNKPDPKIDPKILSHDQLRLELVHRLGWPGEWANDEDAPKTDSQLLAAYGEYDGYCLLADGNGNVDYDGELGVEVLVEWAKGLSGGQRLRLIEILARAPGNAFSSR